jgi:hypothetical protein
VFRCQAQGHSCLWPVILVGGLVSIFTNQGRCHLSMISLQINQLRRNGGMMKKVVQGSTASSVVEMKCADQD